MGTIVMYPFGEGSVKDQGRQEKLDSHARRHVLICRAECPN